MGVSASVSKQRIVQETTNETYQSARAECNTTCQNIQSGNVIVLDNSTAGDITFTQRCEAESGCYMKNSIEALVSAYQDAEIVSESKPAFFPGIQVDVDVNDIEQTINNKMTQVMETLCNAESIQTQTGNIIYATDSTVGNIGFLQEGDAKADCVMENIGRLTAQLGQSGTAISKQGGAVGGIMGIIVAVIVIVLVIYVIRKFNKTKQQTGPSPGAAAAAARLASRPVSTGPAGGGISDAISSATGGASGASSGSGGLSSQFSSLAKSFGGRRGRLSFGK